MMMAVSLTFFGVVRHHSAAFLRATAPAAPLTVYESIATPSGSEAGTALRYVYANLAGAQKELGSRGTLVGPDNRAVPLADMLDELERLYGADPGVSGAAAVKDLFKTEEAVKLFTQFWGRADEVRELAEAQRAAAAQGLGFATAMQQARDNTADARLELVQQRWDAVMIQLGESALPAVEMLAGAAAGAADGIGSVAEKWPRLATAATGLGVGMSVLAIAAARAAQALAYVAVARNQGGAWMADRRARKAADAGGAKPPKGSWLGGLGRKGADLGRRPLPRGGAAGALAAGAIMTGTLLASKAAGKRAADSEGEAADSNWGEVIGGTGGALGGAAAGALIGSAVPVAGTVAGAAIGAVAGTILSYAGGEAGAAIGRAIDSPGERDEDPPGQAAPQVARQHVGDVNISVEPHPGETPDELARRVVRLAQEAEVEDLDTALVDGVI